LEFQGHGKLICLLHLLDVHERSEYERSRKDTMARKTISQEELHEIVELVRTNNKTSKSPVWGNKFWTEICGKGKVNFIMTAMQNINNKPRKNVANDAY
jgi:hypothetical protein